MRLRSKIIDRLIRINEKYVFDRRLKQFYLNNRSLVFNNVIDVGANTGQTIDFFLGLNSSCNLFAFEPDRDLFKDLVLKYTNYPSVHLFDLGVSEIDGIKTFHKNLLGTSSSLEQIDLNSRYLKIKAMILGVKPNDIIVEEYPVKVCKLATVLNTVGVSHFDLLKIDTEGHELSCLRGLFSETSNLIIDRIQLESHNDDMYRDDSDEISELLRSRGYRLEARIKHGFGGIEDLIYIDQKKY